MLARMIKQIAEQAQESARRRGRMPPRRPSSSEKRRRQSEKDLQARRFVSGIEPPRVLRRARSPASPATIATQSPVAGALRAPLAGVFLLFSLKVANQWERAVVLRFGKFQGLKGPGLFVLIPIVDEITQLVDQRVRVTDVSAESALTTRHGAR